MTATTTGGPIIKASKQFNFVGDRYMDAKTIVTFKSRSSLCIKYNRPCSAHSIQFFIKTSTDTTLEQSSLDIKQHECNEKVEYIECLKKLKR